LPADKGESCDEYDRRRLGAAMKANQVAAITEKRLSLERISHQAHRPTSASTEQRQKPISTIRNIDT
jgi:hypothetical protein